MFSKGKIYSILTFIAVIIICLANFSSYSQDSSTIKERARIADSTKRADSIKNAKAIKDGLADKSGNPTSSDSATKTKDTSKSNEPQVLRVFSFNTKDSAASIGDVIVIEVLHLNNLLQEAERTGQTISLYINGRRIDAIKPISGAPDKDKGTLQYRLDRNTENDKIWADILGAPPFFTNEFFDKPVKVSAGLANKFAIKTLTEDDNFTFIRIHRGWFWACCVIILFYLFVFFTMVRNNGLLRDRGIDLSAIGIPINSSRNYAFSLGRCQMAFWFMLTVISFFFIWLITDAFNIISATVLALIGISTVTSLSAAVIDNSKNTDLLNQTLALQNELAGLNTQITNLQAQIAVLPTPANLTALQTDLSKAQDRVNEITPVITRNVVVLTPQQSEGFFSDILTDINGVSFHRLQMFVWTLVLGLIFLYSVWKRLSMPEFDATLLALQGLTSGTYLGFKFPEKQA